MSAARWGESILIQTPVRLVVGGLFCLAAYMKLFDRVWAGNDPTLTFAEAIKGYHILDPVMHHHAIVTAAYVLPWVELLAGLLLVIGIWARPAALVSLVLLAGFTAANASVVLRPDVSASCACFGSIEWPCGNSITWCQVGRNAVLMLMSAYILWRGAGLVALEAPGSGTRAAAGDLDD